MTALPLIQPLPWMADAVCNPKNAEVFFPTTSITYAARLEAARHMCNACPVTADCLAYALELDPVDGIWGGLTPEERASLRRKARR